jgi:hypothetical protein
MDAELKHYLDGMKAGIDAALNAAEEWMKRHTGAISDSEQRLKQHMAGMIDASEERTKDFVRETVHDAETRIVGSCMQLAATHEARMGTLESSDRGLMERVAMREARVLNLERRSSRL